MLVSVIQFSATSRGLYDIAVCTWPVLITKAANDLLDSVEHKQGLLRGLTSAKMEMNKVLFVKTGWVL